MPVSPEPTRRLAAVGLHVLALLMVAGVPGCGSKGGAGGAMAAPPVAVKPMPPIPDLSKVRTFTTPIPGLPTNRNGITAAALQQLGDLRYPEAAWNQGLQGWAVYDFVVSRDGGVDQRYVRLVAASDSLFTRPAEEAVRSARFAPATQGGTGVATLVRLPVYFSLDQAARRR
jgi:TonB family protein